MADVFISYKRENRPMAAALEGQLKARGYSIWRDTSLVAGEQFNSAIQRELKAAGCVVVLWTEASLASRFVQAEAIQGFDRNILVSARLDNVEVEYPYAIDQIADLRTWTGDSEHSGLGDFNCGRGLKGR